MKDSGHSAAMRFRPASRGGQMKRLWKIFIAIFRLFETAKIIAIWELPVLRSFPDEGW